MDWAVDSLCLWDPTPCPPVAGEHYGGQGRVRWSSETKTLFFFFLPCREDPLESSALPPKIHQHAGASVLGLCAQGRASSAREGSFVGKHECSGKTSTRPQLMWFSSHSQMMVCVYVCKCVQYAYCVCE